MDVTTSTFKGAFALLSIAALAACGAQPAATNGTTSTASTSSVTCVPISDGGLYTIADGKFVPTEVEAEVITTVAPLGWAADVEKTFPSLGFPWMGLRERGGIATLTGLAPDTRTRDAAFAAGSKAIRDNPEGRNVSTIVDAIAVEGGEAAVGAGLATLQESALSLEACQQAFSTTMQGRNVQFQTSRSVIRGSSARLLDALTGVAILCKDYNVEIGGHADARGADDLNLRLSQSRADAVRNYLIDKGVSPSGLTAVGYGETRPIDTRNNAEAYAINRRTEFVVSAK